MIKLSQSTCADVQIMLNYKNMDHLPSEYSAGVAEDGHELEVGFGER